MPTDSIFQMTGSTVRFGEGATREVGADFVDLGCRRVLAFIDPAVRASYPGESALESLRSAGVDFDVFTDIRCEPTDGSFRDAIAAASSGGFDGFLAVGGGSTIDTAKAANLYATWPADFLEYVNPTLGRGKTPPGPLKPLIAVPTTAGHRQRDDRASPCSTSSASASRPASRTATCVRRSASSIPRTPARCPKAVAASAGLDVLSHALESFTARHYLATRAAGTAVAALRLPGGEPDQRRLGARGAADHGRVPAARVRDPSR